MSSTKKQSFLIDSFKKNKSLYFQEALGLAIFMISACFFTSEIFSPKGFLYSVFSNFFERNIFMGICMGLTALFIFYSPITSKSGSQINPAVTLTFLRLKKINFADAVYYILFQFLGGTLAVYIMQFLLGNILIEKPINYVVTVPFKNIFLVLSTEFIISFITMLVILTTSVNTKWQSLTRILAAFLVCIWVIIAGPISGFGMNPARSFASAFPAQIWTSFWIYLLMPILGMLSAAEFFLYSNKLKIKK